MCRFSWCCCTFISSEAPSSLCLSLPFLVFGLKSNILTLLFAYLACLGHVFYNKSAAIGCCTFAIISICHIRPSRTPSSFFRPTAHYLTAQSKHCRHSVRTPMPFRHRSIVPERLSLCLRPPVSHPRVKPRFPHRKPPPYRRRLLSSVAVLPLHLLG